MLSLGVGALVWLAPFWVPDLYVPEDGKCPVSGKPAVPMAKLHQPETV